MTTVIEKCDREITAGLLIHQGKLGATLINSKINSHHTRLPFVGAPNQFTSEICPVLLGLLAKEYIAYEKGQHKSSLNAMCSEARVFYILWMMYSHPMKPKVACNAIR